MKNENFESGLSPKILALVKPCRPPSEELTFDQIATLAKFAQYRIKGENSFSFLLYSINDDDEDIRLGVGIENGLRLNWDLIISSSGFAFRPTLEALVPGTYLNPSESMIKNLEHYLPKIGIKPTDITPWPKDDPAGMVPIDLYLQKKEDATRFILLSEFKAKYRRLYNDLKHIFENE